MPTPSIARSKFVYPFIFDINTFCERCIKIDGAQVSSAEKTWDLWRVSKYSEQDLLPHVANYINNKIRKNGKSLETVGVWKIQNDILQSPNFGLGSGQGSGSIQYKLCYPHGKIEFKITDVELFLFRTGMGALAIAVEPTLENGNLSSWYDFLSYFKWFQDRHGVSIECSKGVGFDQEKREPIRVSCVPPLAAQVENSQDGTFQFGDILSGLLRSGGLDPEGGEKWWSDVFVPNQFLPYSTLFLEDTPPEEIPIHVYQFRKMLHSRQTLIPPKFEISLEHEALHAYVENQWFTFSLDGGGFIAFNAPDTYFFTTELPIHLMDQYFMVFIMALHQRFVLTRLADEVAKVWLAEDDENSDTNYFNNLFGELQKIFLTFYASGNFKQIMQRDNLHQVYNKWLEVFQIDQLSQSVYEAIEHIHGFIQAKQDLILKQIEEAQRQSSKRLERQINKLMLIIGVPAVLFPFYEMVRSDGFLMPSLMLIGGIIIGGFLLKMVSKSS